MLEEYVIDNENNLPSNEYKIVASEFAIMVRGFGHFLQGPAWERISQIYHRLQFTRRSVWHMLNDKGEDNEI